MKRSDQQTIQFSSVSSDPEELEKTSIRFPKGLIHVDLFTLSFSADNDASRQATIRQSNEEEEESISKKNGGAWVETEKIRSSG